VITLVRYCRTIGLLAGFQYREDAERFLKAVAGAHGEIGLELHPEKTPPESSLGDMRRAPGQARGREAETFNFLGFTHICGTSHKTGYFTVHRKTIGKRMAAS